MKMTNVKKLPDSLMQMIGKKYGNLYVSNFAYEKPVFDQKRNRVSKRLYFVKCRCDCGNEKIINAETIRRHQVISCGCSIKQRLKSGLHIKHGQTNTRLYRIWCKMKNRCYDSKCADFQYWGGKDIKLCSEWKNNFNNFYDWAMNNGYKENLTIDRIDGNKDYCPDNCRWATPKEQANNTKRNRLIFYKNQTKTLAQWCDFFGMRYGLIRDRIDRYHWTFDKAITTKVLKRK